MQTIKEMQTERSAVETCRSGRSADQEEVQTRKEVQTIKDVQTNHTIKEVQTR